VTDHLLMLGQMKCEQRVDARQGLRCEVRLIGRAAPDIIAGINRLHVRRQLPAYARANAVAADQNVRMLDAAVGEFHAHAAVVLVDVLEVMAEVVVAFLDRCAHKRCRRSHEVRICRNGRSPVTRPLWSMAMRFDTSTPRFFVPAPLASSASNNSGWPV